jgi:fibronectin type III domain protein
MKRGDLSNIGKMRLIIAILGGFLITASLPAIATQNVTLNVPGVASVGLNQSQGGGLSVNAMLQLPQIQSVTLAWKPSISPNVVGYDVYFGGLSGIYTNEISIGNVTNVSIPNLLGGATYYFVVTAVNSSGIKAVFRVKYPILFQRFQFWDCLHFQAMDSLFLFQECRGAIA